MHVHEGIDATVFVLSGEVVAIIDGVEATYGPGDAMFIPRDVEHTYTVISPEGASLLAFMAPGGFEVFFAAASAEDLRIPRDMARLNELAAEYNLRFTGPPLPMT